MGSPKICLRCHQKQHGCCLISESSFHFGLSNFEIEQIALETEKDPNSFVTANKVVKWFYDSLIKINSLYKELMPAGIQLRLKTKENKNECVFLARGGCQLSYSIRPFMCRLYPFMFNDSGNLHVFESSFCLAQKTSKDITHVLFLMETSRDILLDVYQEFKKAAYINIESLKKGFSIYEYF